MGRQGLEEGVRNAWAEVRAHFRKLETGTAAAVDDPHPRLAREPFDLWTADPESELVMIGISRDQNEGRRRQVVEPERLSWSQIREPTTVSDGVPGPGRIATAYNAWGIPRPVLIDRAGRIVAKDLRREALVDAVREAISQPC